MSSRRDAPPVLGDWIRRRRRALDLTQEALAERLGYATPTLQKIERGERRPSHELAQRLIDVLSLDPAEHERFLRVARAAPSTPERPPPQEPPARPAPLRPAPPPTAMLGREAERDALWARLRSSEGRLVTLLGPGGIGKTTLALHVATMAADDTAAFPDGAAVAALAATTTVPDLLRAIATAVGLSLQGTREPADQLLDALRQRRLLLVLDNLEQLLAASESAALATFLHRLLAEAPGVRLLVTSRERLRLRAEWVLELAGLPLPPPAAARRASPSAAVDLFLERAQRVSSSFAPNQEQLATIATICRRLEGVPLAIELAAAWCRALAPSEIAAELDRALDFLTSTTRDLSAGHESMRATLDRSWRLLTPEEQRTLAQLAVFRGGCERDAATAVVGATLATLTALIDKSLLRREMAGDATRYTLHALVHQYAAERLASDPDEQQAAEQRHIAFYAGMLQRAIDPSGRLAPATRASINRDSANLRIAWDRAVAGEHDTLAVMTRNMAVLFDSNSWIADGVALFGRAAETLVARSARPELCGLMLGYQGYYLLRAGAFLAARTPLEAGRAAIEAAGVAAWLPIVTLNLGMVEHRLGQLDAAAARLSQAGALAHAHGDLFVAAWAEQHLGLVATDRGDDRAAEEHYKRFQQAMHGDTYTIYAGVSLVSLAAVAGSNGRHAEALTQARAAMQAAASARDPFVLSLSLAVLGMLALHTGDLDEAHYLFLESTELLRVVGDRGYLGDMLGWLMLVAAARGAGAEARAIGAELIEQARQGAALLVPELCYGLALLRNREGAPAEALALLRVVEEVPARQRTRQRAAQLRAGIAGQPGAPAPARTTPQGAALLTWLEELCAQHPPGSAPGQPERSVAEQPVARPDARTIPATGESLSPREREVLGLLVTGASNQQIAATLVISLHTVKRHVTNILQKLGASSRLDAVARARTLGLTA